MAIIELLVHTENRSLGVKRLKQYLPPLKHGAPPLHFDADKETLVDSETFIIEKILNHQEFANRGGDKRTRPKILKWLVKYKGYPKLEWHEASEFLHHINEDWLKYCRRHGLHVGIRDVSHVMASVHSSFLS